MDRQDENQNIKLGKSLRIGEILVKQKIITEDQLKEALKIQATKKKLLGEILIDQGYLDEDTLGRILAKEFLLPFVNLSEEQIDGNVIRLFPVAVLKKCRVFPLRLEGNTLVLATSDPLDIMSLQEIGRLSGFTQKLVMAPRRQIESFVNKYVLTEKQNIPETVVSQASAETPAVDEAPTIRLVSSLIEEAIGQNASDIHLEPQADGLLVRFRIDGVLYEKMRIPANTRASVLSRVKIMSGMDITEKRVPQDGRTNVKLQGSAYDIRVSTLPGVFGEKIVLRILNQSSILIPLENLGPDEYEMSLLERLIKRPYGIILITGPTGSGKTTTLYSILNKLNEVSRNIVTVEDPVEYELSRIHQTAINVKAGYTFARAIRHILRQDPDVIMVGEIRDVETAEVAIQAAITGHLVLSTLHTNNASGAITRLLDMNVEPFLITSAVIGVVAQRLIRKLCPYCKTEYQAPEEMKTEIGGYLSSPAEPLILARPQGCSKCNDIGYNGRTGIYEILVMNDAVRDLTLKKAGEPEISKAAISGGMRTLRGSGIKKAVDKITSLEEVMRTVFIDQI